MITKEYFVLFELTKKLFYLNDNELEELINSMKNKPDLLIVNEEKTISEVKQELLKKTTIIDRLTRISRIPTIAYQEIERIMFYYYITLNNNLKELNTQKLISIFAFLRNNTNELKINQFIYIDEISFNFFVKWCITNKDKYGEMFIHEMIMKDFKLNKV